jgi:aromatic-L-amino-acid/L-tryptophan decarboxylase
MGECAPDSGEQSPDSGDPESAAWASSPELIERLGTQVARMIAGYLGGLPSGAVHQAVPEPLRQAWAAEPAPRAGRPAEQILKRFASEIAPYPFGNGHPRFFAWVNSPPAVIGVFAESLAAAMNPSVAGGDHAAVYLERQVVGWFAGLAGLPAAAGGLLVSGASMATLTALAVARHRVLSAAGVNVRASGLRDGPRLLLYASPEAHGCVRKAAELLGIGSDNIVQIEVDRQFAIRPEALARSLAAGREAGALPVAVVASAGTVNTGAIDPLRPISEICADYGAWLHVDAAYGGPAVLLTEEFASARDALSRADSIAIDPHKWLYVPVDAGLVLFGDLAAAREAFSLIPPYLRTDDDPAGGPWFSEYGFDQTRPFRALKIWMAIQNLGLDGYRELITNDLRIAACLRDAVSAAPDLELMAGGLSVACFRYRPPDWPPDPGALLDELNRRLVRNVQQGGRAFVAGTTVRGQFALRACVVNPGTTRSDVGVLLDEVRACGRQLAGAAPD